MAAIVVPLDGSEFAERALGVARTLADATHGALTLVQVIAKPWRLDTPGDLTILLERAARSYLAEVALKAGPGLVESEVLMGHPVDELLGFVTAHDALLVMSTHGRGGFERAVFGSVADKVMRGATAPLVIVPVAASSVADPLTDLIVPLDGSALSAVALPHALALARATGATLRLTWVVEPIWDAFFTYGSPMSMYVSDAQLTRMQQDADAEASDYLAALAASLADTPGGIEQTVRHGRPAAELLRMSEDFPHGLLVMATHGRGGLRRWALGSVTTEVTQRSTLPIMVVPSLAAAEQQGGAAA